MKDWMLVVIVLLVVGVDLFIHTVGTAIPETRLNATLVPDELTPHGVDVRIMRKNLTIEHGWLCETNIFLFALV